MFFLLLEDSKAIIYKTLKYIFFIFNLKTYYMLKCSRLEILKLLFNIQIKKRKRKKSLRGCRKYSNNSRNQMARAGLTA